MSLEKVDNRHNGLRFTRAWRLVDEQAQISGVDLSRMVKTCQLTPWIRLRLSPKAMATARV